MVTSRPGKRHSEGVVRDRRFLAALLALTYGAVLHVAYYTFVAPIYGYIGYAYKDPNLLYYGISLFICAAITTAMPGRIEKASDFVLWVMHIIATIPSLLVPHYVEAMDSNSAFALSLVVSSAWLIPVAMSRSGQARILPHVECPSQFIWAVIATTSAGVYIWMFATTGLSLQFLRLDSVLDTRLQYRETLESAGGLLAYAILLQGNVLNPLFLSFGVARKNFFLIAAGAVGQLLIFSATGYKTMILSTIFITVAAIYTRRRKWINGRLVLVFALALCVSAVSIDALAGDDLLTLVFVNRLLLTPGVLSAAHVYVFDQIGYVYWSNSVLSTWIDYPFPLGPSFMVGEIFSNSPITSANANVFADGYMNLGYLGIYLECVLLGFLLILLNDASRRVPLGIICGLLVIPSFALSNTGVLTALLTHGFLAICLLSVLVGGQWSSDRKDELPISGNRKRDSIVRIARPERR